MTTTLTTTTVENMSDDSLLVRLKDAAGSYRRHTVEILLLLSEVEARDLHLQQGCSSLFTYCTEVLRFSEAEAYHRIHAAHAVRRFPAIGRLLRSGDLTLTTVNLLSSHLTVENYESVLRTASGKSKREVEALIAAIDPRPAEATLVRRLPEARRGVAPAQSLQMDRQAELRSGQNGDSRQPSDPAGAVKGPEVVRTNESGPPSVPLIAETQAGEHATAPGPVFSLAAGFSAGPAAPPRAAVVPLSPDRYLLRVTIPAHTHTKLRYAQNLARHSVPSGDIATILDRALTLFVLDLERVKLARVDRPRSKSAGDPTGKAVDGPRRSAALRSGTMSRRIPSEVRRAVWVRDQGRCTFAGAEGRCRSVEWLEFHHIVPFAAGGPATVDNITLRCRAHNQYEADVQAGTTQRRSG